MKTETKNISLYQGEIDVVFYPNSHQYKINGKNIKSVTRVLSIINKPQLLIWATNLARAFLKAQLIDGSRITNELIDEGCSLYTKTKDEAADVGKVVHGWIEEFVKNKIEGGKKIVPIPENEQAANGVLGFMNWFQSCGELEFLFSEKLVYSKKNNYIGTLDLGMKLNGKNLLIDIKSSKAIYADYLLQTIAYVEAYEEEYGEIFDGVGILRFEKGTGEENEEIKNPFQIFTLLKTDPLYKLCHQAFLGALQLQTTLEEVNKLLKS